MKIIKTIQLTDREMDEYGKMRIFKNHWSKSVGRILHVLLTMLSDEETDIWNNVARRAGYESLLAMFRAGCRPRINWPLGVIEIVEDEEE